MANDNFSLVMRIKALENSRETLVGLGLKNLNDPIEVACKAGSDALDEQIDRLAGEAEKELADKISTKLDNVIADIERDFLEDFDAAPFSKESYGKEKCEEIKQKLCKHLAILFVSEAVDD